jgi:hypothetical protein
VIQQSYKDWLLSTGIVEILPDGSIQMHECCLTAKIQGTKQVIDNLAPGEVAIIHKRAEKGVFVKRK